MPQRKKRFLFVCTAAMQRSPTAAELFKNHPLVEAKFAGVSELAATPLTKSAVEWADVIFVMESYHKDYLQRYFPKPSKPVIVLDIPDIYWYNEPELVALLRDKLKAYLK